MSEDVTPTADPSPAAIEPSYDLASLSSDQRAEWQKTGNWPTDQAAAKPGASDTTPISEPNGKTEAASDPAKVTEETPKSETPEQKASRLEHRRNRNAERRIGQLLAENKRLQQQMQERGSQPHATAQPNVGQEPEFATFEERDAYIRKQERERAVAEYEASQREKTSQQQHEANRQQWFKKVETWAKANPNAASTFNEAFQEVAQAVDGANAVDVYEWIRDSEVGPAIIAHFYENDDALEDLLNASGRARGRLFDKIEDSFKTSPKIPPQITRAPKPPSEVGSRPSPKDELDAAQSSDNVSEYFRIANKRQLERMGRR